MPAETHMSGEPMSRVEFVRDVCDRIAELCGAPEGVVAVDSRFVDDLGFDDVTLIDIVTAIEEEYGERNVGIALDDEQIVELATVGELIEILAPNLGVEPA
jgi:acyl carrier protein